MLPLMAASEPVATSPFTTPMGHAAQPFQGLGALILTIGLLWSVVLAVLAWRRSGSLQRANTALRQAFGATLLLGLEILVAADLIRTVAVAPTLDNVLVQAPRATMTASRTPGTTARRTGTRMRDSLRPAASARTAE